MEELGTEFPPIEERKYRTRCWRVKVGSMSEVFCQHPGRRVHPGMCTVPLGQKKKKTEKRGEEGGGGELEQQGEQPASVPDGVAAENSPVVEDRLAHVAVIDFFLFFFFPFFCNIGVSPLPTLAPFVAPLPLSYLTRSNPLFLEGHRGSGHEKKKLTLLWA